MITEASFAKEIIRLDETIITLGEDEHRLSDKTTACLLGDEGDYVDAYRETANRWKSVADQLVQLRWQTMEFVAAFRCRA